MATVTRKHTVSSKTTTRATAPQGTVFLTKPPAEKRVSTKGATDRTDAHQRTARAMMEQKPEKSAPKQKRVRQDPDAYHKLAEAMMEMPGPSSRLTPDMKLVLDLQGIKDRIQDLVDRADRLVRAGAPHEYERAKGYWLGQMRMALDGNSMCNMAETIAKIARDAGV